MSAAPADAEALLAEGRWLWQAGRIPAARAALERALAVDVDCADAWRWLSFLLSRYYRSPDQAAAAAERAVRLRPDAPALRALGEALELGGSVGSMGSVGSDTPPDFPYSHPGAAAAAYRQAIALDPEDLSSRGRLAALLERLGDTDAALAELHAALAEEPTHLPSALALFRLAVERGRLDLAERAAGALQALTGDAGWQRVALAAAGSLDSQAGPAAGSRASLDAAGARDRPPTAGCQPPTSDCRPPAADCGPPTADCQPPTSDCQPPTGHWPLVTGHWPLVTGHWSLVTGHWPLVTGHWSPATAACRLPPADRHWLALGEACEGVHRFREAMRCFRRAADVARPWPAAEERFARAAAFVAFENELLSAWEEYCADVAVGAAPTPSLDDRFREQVAAALCVFEDALPAAVPADATPAGLQPCLEAVEAAFAVRFSRPGESGRVGEWESGGMGERGGGRAGEWESGRVGDEEGIGDGGRPAETRSRRVLAVPADLRYGHVRCVEERDLPGPGGPPAVGRQGECESAALPALSVSVVALRAPLPIAGAQAWRLAGTLAPDPWSETRGAQTFILAPDPEPHRWAWLWNRTRAHMEARRPAVIAEEQPQLPGSALPATPDCERCPTSGDAPAAAASDTPAEGSGAVSPELVHRLWLAHGTSVWLDAHRREPGDLRTRFLLTCAWQERESGILLEATRVTRALAGLSTSEGASEVLLTAMACGPRPHADLAAALPMRPPAAGDARAAGATDALRRLLAEAGTASPTPLSALSPESLSALARRAGE